MLFELRLALALGKTRQEIRKIPYPEFLLWQTYYLVEPFGFPDQEYRTAAVLAAIANSNITKKSQAKSPSDFIRDMPVEVLKWLKKLIGKQDQEEKYKAMDDAQKREFIRNQMIAITGKPVKDE